MLIKRSNLMTSKPRTVKFSAIALTLLTGISTSLSAVPAHADNSMLTERKVTVKFSTSDIQDYEGVKKTYAKLEKRAKSACRSDSATLFFTGQSVQDCAADLMEQFLRTANIDVLNNYHVSKSEASDTPEDSLTET